MLSIGPRFSVWSSILCLFFFIFCSQLILLLDIVSVVDDLAVDLCIQIQNKFK